MIVHVPMTYDSGMALPAGTLAGYHRAFSALGPMVDHLGNGSWINPAGKLVLERNDDVFVTTTLTKARAFLPGFLSRLRRELRTGSVLGEMVTGASPMKGEEARTQVEVDVPTQFATAVARALAADAGGSSQYAVNGIEHLSVDATAAMMPSLRATLTRMQRKWTEAPVLFVLVVR
jgi:hypothetical protein